MMRKDATTETRRRGTEWQGGDRVDKDARGGYTPPARGAHPRLMGPGPGVPLRGRSSCIPEGPCYAHRAGVWTFSGPRVTA